MNRITDVTRQDLIDIIESGIWVPLKEPEFDRESGEYIDGYSVKMSPYGRLNEIDFLSRIYDLDKMPSTDSRFLNARRDIWQHTINNEDWDEYWYFSDDRFHLSNGNDDKATEIAKKKEFTFSDILRIALKEYIANHND